MNARRTVVGLVCSLALLGLPFAGSAQAADEAAPTIKSASTDKEVYALKQSAQSVVARVRVTDSVGVTKVYAKLYAPGKASPTYSLALSRVSGTAKDGVWQGAVSVKLPVALGKWSIRAAARDAAGNSTGNSAVIDTFSIKRYVLMNSWQAEQACADECTRLVKGKVNLAVSLLLLEPENNYSELKGQKVQIEFRKKGTTTWVPQGSPPGIDGGIYYGNMTSSGDGDWRARYYGTSVYAGNLTKPIYVDMQ